MHEAATLAHTILDRNARTQVAPATNAEPNTLHAIAPASPTLNEFPFQGEPFTAHLPRATPQPVTLPNPTATLALDPQRKSLTGARSNPEAPAAIQGETSSRATPASSNGDVRVDPLTALQVAAVLLQPKPGAEPRPWSTWHPLVKAAVIGGSVILAAWGLARFITWLRNWWARQRERDATFANVFASPASPTRGTVDVDALVRVGWPREAFA